MDNKDNEKGKNPKGQGPSKPKKEKTKEEKEAARAKAAEKKRLKKEQAKLLEEANKNSGKCNIEDKKENKNEEKKKEDKQEKKKEKKEIKNEKKEEKKDSRNNVQNEETLEKKEIYKFYGIKSYEERVKEKQRINDEKDNNPNNDFSLRRIIQHLSSHVQYSSIGKELIIALRNIFLCGSSKQTKNCFALLEAIKIIIDSIDGENYEICEKVSSLILKVIELLKPISEKSSGIENTCKYLKQITDIIFKFRNEEKKNLSKWIKEKIQYFIDKRIKQIEDDKLMENLIKNGDTILIYGKSKVFRKLLWKAKDNNINFNVIIVVSQDKSKISGDIEFFSKLGLNVKFTDIKGVNNVMSEVSKVFIKVDSVMTNGGLLGKKGTNLLSLISKRFNKPVYAFCPTFKFMNKIILNNNFELEKKKEDKFGKLVFEFDITPPIFIQTVICEIGWIQPNSISMYIRKLEKNDEEFIET